MQNHSKVISIAVVLVFLFSACEETIEFKPEQLQSKIVINGLLIANKKISVSISKSESRLENKYFYDPLSNAKADLYVNDELAETLQFESRPDTVVWKINYNTSKKIPCDKGVFISSITAEAGKTYRLEVSCKGMDNAVCETEVPYPVEIISIDTFTRAITEGASSNRDFISRVKFKDPANTSNYYRFQIDNTNGTPIQQYINNEYVSTDTIILEDNYVSPYYLDDPIFKYSENEANDIVLGEPDNQYSIFDDSKIDGLEYAIKTELYTFNYNNQQNKDNGNFIQQRFSLYCINKNYFDYLNTANYHFWFEDDYFAEPVQVYSNVNGGLGIWAAANISTHIITQGKYPLPGKTYMTKEEYYKDKNYGYGYESGYGGYY